MKSINLLILLTLIFSLSSHVWAENHMPLKSKENKHHHKKGEKHNHSNQKATLKKIGKDKLVVKVKGMVCAFCAQGIEKNFNKQNAVESTKVDLDTMEVTVKLKKGKELPESVIKEVVTDAGFSYVGVRQ